MFVWMYREHVSSYTHIYMYIYTYIHVSIHTYIYIYTYTCIYVVPVFGAVVSSKEMRQTATFMHRTCQDQKRALETIGRRCVPLLPPNPSRHHRGSVNGLPWNLLPALRQYCTERLEGEPSMLGGVWLWVAHRNGLTHSCPPFQHLLSERLRLSA